VHERQRVTKWIVLMVIRKRNSKRCAPRLQYLAIVGRRVLETVGSMLHNPFPRRTHAVTQEGLVLKVLLLVLAHRKPFRDLDLRTPHNPSSQGLKSKVNLPAIRFRRHG